MRKAAGRESPAANGAIRCAIALLRIVLWSFVMTAWLYATRIPAIAMNNVVYDPRRPSEEFHVQLPAQVRWKADNYNNLMEQLTLSYAVTLTSRCSVPAVA